MIEQERVKNRRLSEVFMFQIVRKELDPLRFQSVTKTTTLYPFACAIESGDLTLHEHADMKWLMPEELHTLDWAEADLPVIAEYLANKSVVAI